MKIRNGFVSNSSSSSFILTLAEPHKVDVDGVVKYYQERYEYELEYLEKCREKNSKYLDSQAEETSEALKKLEEAKAHPDCGRRIRMKVNYGGEKVANELGALMVKLGVAESYDWKDC